MTDQAYKAETVLFKMKLPRKRTLERLQTEWNGNIFKWRMGYAGCMYVMGNRPLILWFRLNQHIKRWHNGEYAR